MQIHHCCNLYQQNSRNAIFEFLVHGFMMPDSHSRPCPDASSKNSQHQERGFRNAPLGFLSLVFVYAVHYECNSVDDNKIVGENIMHICKIEPMYKSVFGGQSEDCIFTKKHIKSTKIDFFSFFCMFVFRCTLKIDLLCVVFQILALQRHL